MCPNSDLEWYFDEGTLTIIGPHHLLWWEGGYRYHESLVTQLYELFGTGGFFMKHLIPLENAVVGFRSSVSSPFVLPFIENTNEIYFDSSSIYKKLFICSSKQICFDKKLKFWWDADENNIYFDTKSDFVLAKLLIEFPQHDIDF